MPKVGDTVRVKDSFPHESFAGMLGVVWRVAPQLPFPVHVRMLHSGEEILFGYNEVETTDE